MNDIKVVGQCQLPFSSFLFFTHMTANWTEIICSPTEYGIGTVVVIWWRPVARWPVVGFCRRNCGDAVAWQRAPSRHWCRCQSTSWWWWLTSMEHIVIVLVSSGSYELFRLWITSALFREPFICVDRGFKHRRIFFDGRFFLFQFTSRVVVQWFQRHAFDTCCDVTISLKCFTCIIFVHGINASLTWLHAL